MGRDRSLWLVSAPQSAWHEQLVTSLEEAQQAADALAERLKGRLRSARTGLLSLAGGAFLWRQE
jgi:hypothetical protein